MEKHALLTAIVGIVGGTLTVVFRKFSVRTGMEGITDRSRMFDPKRQETLLLVIGLGMVGFGLFALVVWLT